MENINSINQEKQINKETAFPFTVDNLIRNLLFLLFFIFVIYNALISMNGIWIACFLIFFFYDIGVYSFTFHEDKLVLKYIYLRKKEISKDQITRITIKKSILGDKLEIDYKKTRRHSTRIMKIPLSRFKKLNISNEEILTLMKSTFGK